MTDQPLDPAAIEASHGILAASNWCPECLAVFPCEPYRLAEALRDCERDLAAERAKVADALYHLTDVPVGGWEWAVVDARAALVGEGAADVSP